MTLCNFPQNPSVKIKISSTDSESDVLGECTFSDVGEGLVGTPTLHILGHLAADTVPAVLCLCGLCVHQQTVA